MRRIAASVAGTAEYPCLTYASAFRKDDCLHKKWRIPNQRIAPHFFKMPLCFAFEDDKVYSLKF